MPSNALNDQEFSLMCEHCGAEIRVALWTDHLNMTQRIRARHLGNSPGSAREIEVINSFAQSYGESTGIVQNAIDQVLTALKNNVHPPVSYTYTTVSLPFTTSPGSATDTFYGTINFAPTWSGTAQSGGYWWPGAMPVGSPPFPLPPTPTPKPAPPKKKNLAPLVPTPRRLILT